MGANNIRLTIEEVKRRIYEKDPTIELLSRKYINSKTKLVVLCKLDGYIWMASFNNLMRKKHRCQICSGVKVNIKVAKNRVFKWHPNIEVLTTCYTSTKQKFHLRCKTCGNEWSCAFKHIEHSNGCPRCDREKQGIMRRKSLDEANLQIVDKTNGMLKIVDTEFMGIKKQLMVECSDCGSIYEDTYVKIMGRNIGCLKCDRTTLNIAEAERKKDSWVNKIGYFYIIRCYNENEEFYKVGITRHSLQNRYSDRNMPYYYEIIKLHETDLYRVTHIENDVIKIGRKRNFSITPDIDFAGRTECFSKEILDISEEIIGRRILDGQPKSLNFKNWSNL